MRKLAIIGLGGVARQRWQQDGAQRHAQHASGELHQPVGVIHPRHAAGHQQRGKNGVDHQRHLANRHAKNRRAHLLENAVYPGVREIHLGPRQHADAAQIRQLKRQLRHAAGKHRPAQRQHWRVEIRRQQGGKHNKADVQQGGGKGRNGKLPPGVQHAAGQRGQRNQQDIRKSDAQQGDGEGKLVAIAAKAWRRQINHPGRRQHAQRRHRRQRQRQHAGHIGQQRARGVFALFFFVFGQHRHKSLRERAFGKNAPQQIGQLERHKKRVSGHAGAKGAGNDGVAGKAENARNQGHAADSGQRLQ